MAYIFLRFSPDVVYTRLLVSANSWWSRLVHLGAASNVLGSDTNSPSVRILVVFLDCNRGCDDGHQNEAQRTFVELMNRAKVMSC